MAALLVSEGGLTSQDFAKTHNQNALNLWLHW